MDVYYSVSGCSCRGPELVGWLRSMNVMFKNKKLTGLRGLSSAQKSGSQISFLSGLPDFNSLDYTDNTEPPVSDASHFNISPLTKKRPFR